MTVIQTKRVVVTPSGETFESPGAMRRHEYQHSIGKARTTVQIRRVSTPQPNVDEGEGNDGRT